MLAEIRSMTTTPTDAQKDESLEIFMRLTEGGVHPDTAVEILRSVNWNIRMAVEMIDGRDPVLAEPFRGNGSSSAGDSQHPGRNRTLSGASVDWSLVNGGQAANRGHDQPEGEPPVRVENRIAIRNWTGVLAKLLRYRQRLNLVRRTFGQTGPWLQRRYANGLRIDDKVGEPVRYG